jgi:hypothetical protein
MYSILFPPPALSVLECKDIVSSPTQPQEKVVKALKRLRRIPMTTQTLKDTMIGEDAICIWNEISAECVY